jgi:GntR family transcriptional regulator, transcriptional repressor for pyruvate dehydrogenase complex
MVESFASGETYQRMRAGAADQVLHDIRDQILSGRLSRGTRLPSEKELAAHYDVSSPTVREAIRALSAMSLVTVRHGAGTYVTAEPSLLMATAINAVVELERVSLPDVFDMSEVIYLKAARSYLEAVERPSLAGLRAAAEAFRPDLSDEELQAALKEFLTALVGLCDNKLVNAIAAHLIEVQIAAARRAAERSPEAWRRIAVPLREERLAIVEALERSDAAAADAAVRAYMRRGHELVTLHASDHEGGVR